MKEVEQVEMTENLEFAPYRPYAPGRPYAPHVVISTAGRNLRMVKSHQKLSSDLLDIIDFSITIDRTYPLAKMVFLGILRSLPAVEMTKGGKGTRLPYFLTPRELIVMIKIESTADDAVSTVT